VRHSLEVVIRDPRHNTVNRLTAVGLFARGLDETAAAPLLALARGLEDGPVLADVLRRAGKYPKLAATPVLLHKLTSPDAEVRAAAIEALGELRAAEACTQVFPLLQDSDMRVRRAAAGAAGKLGAKQSVEPLL